jgi:hypothetical protein
MAQRLPGGARRATIPCQLALGVYVARSATMLVDRPNAFTSQHPPNAGASRSQIARTAFT